MWSILYKRIALFAAFLSSDGFFTLVHSRSILFILPMGRKVHQPHVQGVVRDVALRVWTELSGGFCLVSWEKISWMVSLLDVHCNSGFRMLVKFWNSLRMDLFKHTEMGKKMGRLLTLVRGHYQGLLFHNMNMMKTMKVLCSREMAPISHLNSRRCHCSVGGSVVLSLQAVARTSSLPFGWTPMGLGKNLLGDRCFRSLMVYYPRCFSSHLTEQG